MLAITFPSTKAGTNELLFRVYQQAAGSWMSSVRYVGGTNLANSKAIISTDHPTMQIEEGTIVGPSPAFCHTSAEPHTIRIRQKTITGLTSTLDFAVVDIDGVRDEAGVSLTLVG